MELKKVALTIGIAVIFALFIVFFVEAVYEQPKYEDFCNQTYFGMRYDPYYQTQEPKAVGSVNTNCTALVFNQTFHNSCGASKGYVDFNYDEKGCPTEAFCEYCSKNFNDANEIYTKNIFWISAIVGLIAIIAGLYLPKRIDAIASGFIFGGIILLLQGTVRVFGNLGKWERVIVLGIELILLIWIGYKKVTEKKELKIRKKK